MVSDLNRVTVGIDAAVVANHQVAIRGSTGGKRIAEDFAVSPNLAGMARLTERLSEYPGALAVAEPTGMSWLSLGHAVNDAECGFALIDSRYSSKLRQAIAGKNKTDVIDADMLATSADLFGLSAGPLPTAGEVALRRAVRRRHRWTAEAHNSELRLWSLAAWAFPDLWKALGESHRLGRAILGRWPHLDQLSRAHTKSVAALCKTYLRDGGDPEQRAGRIRDTARGWARFWTGRLDLDALAWEITELLGMAAGEPIQEKGDVHGAVVVQASRIANLGEAGEVVVSDSVRQLAVGKGFEFQPRGEISLRGFEEAQRVWTVTRSNQPSLDDQQRPAMDSSE